MILTVTLNAAIDRTVAVPNFRLGQRHRAVESRTVAGGKGVNVARALKLLGRPVIATGLAGGATGTRLLERLAEESILNDFTRIAGESRTNLAVVDPTTGEQTEINERGPEVSAEEIDRFVEKLLYLAQGATICVLAGSMPPGVDHDVYARLIGELRDARRRSPCSTPTASRCAPACAPARRSSPPTSARPRRPSATSSTTPTTSGSASTGLIEMGAGEAIITRHWGCAAVVGVDRRRYEVAVDRLEPVSTVGSGDCFLAGYVAARYEGGLAARLPRLRRRLRGRVDPALRRRHARSEARSSACSPGSRCATSTCPAASPDRTH